MWNRCSVRCVVTAVSVQFGHVQCRSRSRREAVGIRASITGANPLSNDQTISSTIGTCRTLASETRVATIWPSYTPIGSVAMSPTDHTTLRFG